MRKISFQSSSFLLHTKYLLPVFGLSCDAQRLDVAADIFVRIFIASSLYRDN